MYTAPTISNHKRVPMYTDIVLRNVCLISTLGSQYYTIQPLWKVSPSCVDISFQMCSTLEMKYFLFLHQHCATYCEPGLKI